MSLGSFGLLGAALATLDDDKIPNEEAIALAPTVGWLMLACTVAIVIGFLAGSERWRRWWLQMEDPRTIGLFRIVFAFLTLCNVNDLWEYFHFLFTDEGIFTADVAREVFAAQQFRGFGDGFGDDVPWGFFDFRGFLTWLQGPKYSLLYFWDTPTFFWCHLWAFEIACVLYIVGLWTRTTGILTFLLFNSIMLKNHLFWEGTELVYRCFLAYLVVSRAGHAYSVDNWLRCRKLRRAGRLSERGGPGGGAGVAPSPAHPSGLEAVYRLIPVWPRRLMMIQLATIYTYTGIVKNGNVWAKGDALYYALNLDHFYRFSPQRISAIFGTNLFRLMTWVTHWWEALFFVLLFGLVVRWALREGLPAMSRERRMVAWAAWAGVVGFAGAVAWVAWPVHFTPFSREWFLAGWITLWGVLSFGWWWIGQRPPVLAKVFGRALRRPVVVDRDFVCRWVLGRRVWLTLGLVFQGHLLVLMNIGQFQSGMLSTAIPYLQGHETAAILSGIGRVLHRLKLPWIPAHVVRGEPPLPAEDPTLPHLHHDTAALPVWAGATALGLLLLGIVVRVEWNPSWWYAIWIAALAPLVAPAIHAARTRRRGEIHVRADGKPSMPWAYGPVGRVLMGTLLGWHIIGVAVWLLPDKDVVNKFKGPAVNVFRKYLTISQTDQSWGMFAPNPPRANVFMRVLVTDADGELWDLRTDVYAPERRPLPFLLNDRWRKMSRRISGGESGDTEWYRKWYARYHCRNWAFNHGGEAPQKVELVKIVYRIPSPEQVRDRGYYVPEDLLERTSTESSLYIENCKTSVVGQLPNEIRERHGLPLLPDNVHKPWLKHKKRKWEQAAERRERERAAAEAKAAGEATPAASSSAAPAPATPAAQKVE